MEKSEVIQKMLQWKYRLISITSDWYHIISLVIDITFICFWYALISLLSIKNKSLASILWDIDKQCRTRSDATLIRIFTFCYQNVKLKFEEKWKNTTQQPLKQKWTGRIDNSGKIHSAYFFHHELSPCFGKIIHDLFKLCFFDGYLWKPCAGARSTERTQVEPCIICIQLWRSVCPVFLVHTNGTMRIVFLSKYLRRSYPDITLLHTTFWLCTPFCKIKSHSFLTDALELLTNWNSDF